MFYDVYVPYLNINILLDPIDVLTRRYAYRDGSQQLDVLTYYPQYADLCRWDDFAVCDRRFKLLDIPFIKLKTKDYVRFYNTYMKTSK